MKVFIYHSGTTDYVTNLIKALALHIEVTDHPEKDCDFFLSLQMGHHAELVNLQKMAPETPFITYVWDCYEWIWEHARGYDWKGYGDLCRVSQEVWVPSEGQRDRLLQHWDISKSKSKVIPAYAQLFDYNDVKDGGYVCDPLRTIPDRHNGWLEKACKELNIPYNHGGRGKGSTGRTWEEYKKFIAEASFIVCPWYEASTGGMSLVEGYNLGKEILICDSPYMGAKDYFGSKANYFKPTYDSLVEELEDMWQKRYLTTNREKQNQFCKENFGIDIMAERMYNRLCTLSS